MSSSLLIENGAIVSAGPRPKVLEGHSILLNEGLISKIAPKGQFRGYKGRRIDATGTVVTPGLINAHTHFYSTFARGMTKAKPAREFMGVLRNLWWRLDSALTLEDCHTSALVALMDSVRHGTTTVIDHHASPNAVRGSLEALERAAIETGVRTCLCYEVSDRDGPAISKEGLEENETFIRHCSTNGQGRIAALFGLHAAFTLSDSTLERATNLGHQLGAGFHIHVAEGVGDQAHCAKAYRRRVVERLNRFGILGPKSIAAHCIHVNSREMAILAETGTFVAHNPQSNMNNAVGVADIVEMAGLGVTLGLGTDAMTTNMLEELRAGLFGQRLARKNPSAGFNEITSALFANNGAFAGRLFGLRLGEIAEGAAGDLALFDYDPPTPLTADSALGHLVFGLSQAQVDTTIVGGRVLMEHRKLKLNIDEARVNARARELSKKLWKRI